MTLTQRGRRLAAAVRTLTRWTTGLALVALLAVVLPTIEHWS